MWGKLATGVTLAAYAFVLAGCSGAQQTRPDSNNNEQLAQMKENRLSFVHSMYPDAELPQVDFERFISEHKREEVLERCFDDFGVEISVSPGGGMSWSAASEAESEKQHVAVYACGIRYPDHAMRGYMMSQEERAFLHDYYTSVVTPCIRSAGYPPPELPPRERFVSGQDQWSVYDFLHVPRFGAEAELRWSDLLLRCPELPAGWDER